MQTPGLQQEPRMPGPRVELRLLGPFFSSSSPPDHPLPLPIQLLVPELVHVLQMPKPCVRTKIRNLGWIIGMELVGQVSKALLCELKLLLGLPFASTQAQWTSVS